MSAPRLASIALLFAAIASTGCRAIAGIEDLEVTTCSDDPKAGLPSCACDGKPCTPEPVLAGGEAKHTIALRITNGELVFAGGRTVLACHVDTCETSVAELFLAKPGRFVVALEVLDKNVYFADMAGDMTQHRTGIFRVVPLSGFPQRELVTLVESPSGIAPERGRIFFTDAGTGYPDGAVGTCPSPKCINPKVIQDHLTVPGQVFIEGDDLYFTDAEFPLGGKQIGALYKCSPATTCASIAHQYGGDALGGDPLGTVLIKEGFIVPAIYFDKRPSKIFLITRDGVPTELVTDPGLALVAAIDSTVYWTNPSKGTIQKLALSEGAKQVTLASDQGAPRAIAVDETHVYWVTETDGTIWRVAR